MIVVVANQKGGEGKSTLAASLAAYQATRKTVLLVDANTLQKSSTLFATRRKKDPVLLSMEARGDLAALLVEQDQRHDLVVVDTPGGMGREFYTAATVADAILVPVTEAADDALATLRVFCEDVRATRPVPVIIVLNRLEPQTALRDRERLAEDIERLFPEARIARTHLTRRVVWKRVLKEGLGIHELDNPVARTEFKDLNHELF